MPAKQGLQPMPDDDKSVIKVPEPAPKSLSPAAERALAEAEARRKLADAAPPAAREVHGRNGLDPVRYGDWEKKGIASDF